MVLYLSRHIKLCVCVWQKRLFIFHWRNFFGPHFERFWTFLTESSPFIGKLKWSFIFMLWKYCGRMWNAGNEKNAFKSNGEVLSHDCHFNGAIRKSYLKTQTSTPRKKIPIERETERERAIWISEWKFVICMTTLWQLKLLVYFFIWCMNLNWFFMRQRVFFFCWDVDWQCMKWLIFCMCLFTLPFSWIGWPKFETWFFFFSFFSSIHRSSQKVFFPLHTMSVCNNFRMKNWTVPNLKK